MASSGTYAFALDLLEVTIEAFERCGIVSEQIDTRRMQAAFRSLNLMYADWWNQDLTLWAIDQQNTPTQAGVNALILPAATIDVLEAQYIRGGIGLDMTAISRDEYFAFPNPDLLGRPTQYWVEKILPTPVLHLYPTPDSDNDIIQINRWRQIQDSSSPAQTAEVPWNWMEALCAGLAAKLAVKFAPAQVPLLLPLAREALTNAREEDRERVPLRLLPDRWA